MSRLRRFFNEAWSELKKVSWPTREQVRNLTVLVFAISAAVGVFISAWDFVFTETIKFLNKCMSLSHDCLNILYQYYKAPYTRVGVKIGRRDVVQTNMLEYES